MVYTQNRKKKALEFLFPGGFKRLATAALIASVFAFPSGARAAAANPQTFDITKLTIEKKAPDFVLTDLNGQKFRLSDHKGKRPVLLIFSTTWCTFCQAEIPHFKSLHASYAKQGLEIVNIDIQESKEKVAKFAAKQRAALPHPAGRGRHGKRRLRSPGGSDDDPRRQKRHDRLPPVPLGGYPPQDDDEKMRGHTMSVLIHFSIFPTDKGTSVSPYVAKAVRIIRESGLPYKVGPMSTAVEGEWSEVMAVVENCFKELRKECSRIYMTLQMDYREGAVNRIEGKIKSIEEKL